MDGNGKDSLHKHHTFERWLLLEIISALGLWLHLSSTFGEGGEVSDGVDGFHGVSLGSVGEVLSKAVLEKMDEITSHHMVGKSLWNVTKIYLRYMYQTK